jgi:hypothetical protein
VPVARGALAASSMRSPPVSDRTLEEDPMWGWGRGPGGSHASRTGQAAPLAQLAPACLPAPGMGSVWAPRWRKRRTSVGAPISWRQAAVRRSHFSIAGAGAGALAFRSLLRCRSTVMAGAGTTSPEVAGVEVEPAADWQW